jgi:hypothetical protein
LIFGSIAAKNQPIPTFAPPAGRKTVQIRLILRFAAKSNEKEGFFLAAAGAKEMSPYLCMGGIDR